jgi:hypothetical protein
MTAHQKRMLNSRTRPPALHAANLSEFLRPKSGRQTIATCSLLFRGAVGEWKKSALDAGGDGQNMQPVIAACCAKCCNAIERKEGETGLSWVHRVAEWCGLHQANADVLAPAGEKTPTKQENE